MRPADEPFGTTKMICWRMNSVVVMSSGLPLAKSCAVMSDGFTATWKRVRACTSCCHEICALRRRFSVSGETPAALQAPWSAASGVSFMFPAIEAKAALTRASEATNAALLGLRHFDRLVDQLVERDLGAALLAARAP